MRKTKIVCTLGPASSNRETIRDMISAGADVMRLNFSHGTHETHKETADLVKSVREELSSYTALLLDTKGPEIRIKSFANGSVTLSEGQAFTLYSDDRIGDENGVSITYTELYRDVTRGSKIMIDDGLIELRVDSICGYDIKCTVLNGGKISNNKGINVPGVKLSIPFLSERDIQDIEFGIKEGFDFVAASFTQCAEDIIEMRRLLERRGARDMKIIAKIENSAGVENCEAILRVADGLMVARGDMGVEIPMEDIPIIQKKLIQMCYSSGKQVITATQMLDSMTKNPRPTRAEITDVANAIYDGTSAIMLSGETAAGLYPVESVKTMAKIACRTESDINYTARFSRIQLDSHSTVTDAISHATCTTASDIGAAAIITVTKTGGTARQISRFRPATPIIGCSTSRDICRTLNLSWGVYPCYLEEKSSTEELFSGAVEAAKNAGFVNAGDLAVITAGIPLGVPGNTNMLKVAEVE